MFRYFNIRNFEISKPRSGGGKNLGRQNGERPVLRNFEIANIITKKDELFDNLFSNFFFIF